jgi:hypothetical protein
MFTQIIFTYWAPNTEIHTLVHSIVVLLCLKHQKVHLLLSNWIIYHCIKPFEVYCSWVAHLPTRWS